MASDRRGNAEPCTRMLEGNGIATGIDLHALMRAGAEISAVFGRPTASRAAQTLGKRAG